MRGGMVGAALVVIIVAAPTWADDKPTTNKDAIVGKWKIQDGPPVVIEFTKDLKIKLSIDADGQKLEAPGSYKWADDNTMEATIEFMGEKKTEKLKIKIKGDDLETTDEKGKVDKLKRVK